MHTQGLFHFDLKLENIMIDGPLELANMDAWVKIIDFGWVRSLLKQREGFETYHQGTEEYNPPEIHNRVPFMGEPVDVFMLGYVLFAMTLSAAPFEFADRKRCQFYNLLLQGKYRDYWSCFKLASTLSEELKDLLEWMFHHDPV